MRVAAVLLPMVAACGLVQARPVDAGSDAQRAAGKAIYQEKCDQCHGEAGDGKGVGADFFRPLPRDFTSGAFKIRSTGSGELPTDADLKAIIKRGMPHTGMPAWPKFNDGELSALAYYLKTFNADFADSANLTDPMETGKAPAFSLESARKGRAVYEENKCMDCHGSLGRGDGESGPTLVDDLGQPMRPADLTKRWTFRGGPAREDIYRTFMTGLNGTPMPSYASSIEKAEDRWALVDYVHSLSPGDKAPYGTVVTALGLPGPVDPGRGRDLFDAAKPALFPVVGQVIEGRRNFFPAVDAVEVRAVYDSSRIFLLVSWHDMSADTLGANSPVEAADSAAGTTGRTDAVAVQIPLEAPSGAAKPFFLFGDAGRPVEIWFQDMALDSAGRYLGKGQANLAKDGFVETRSGRTDGEWWVMFARPRRDEGRMAMEAGAFVPIAFSVWDGFSGETGSARGVTSWSTLYLKPAASGSPLAPAATTAAGVLLAEFAFIWIIRRKLRARR